MTPEAKSQKIEVRLTVAEKTSIECAAKRKGMTVSEWIRSLASAAS